ncbi:MAG TPA: hypothetical protein VKR21_03215 [Solirubrobacteraceae bacterium]|nr:hypothetical protein [Solirubrobacteraceae bacterium]
MLHPFTRGPVRASRGRGIGSRGVLGLAARIACGRVFVYGRRIAAGVCVCGGAAVAVALAPASAWAAGTPTPPGSFTGKEIKVQETGDYFLCYPVSNGVCSAGDGPGAGWTETVTHVNDNYDFKDVALSNQLNNPSQLSGGGWPTTINGSEHHEQIYIDKSSKRHDCQWDATLSADPTHFPVGQLTLQGSAKPLTASLGVTVGVIVTATNVTGCGTFDGFHIGPDPTESDIIFADGAYDPAAGKVTLNSGNCSHDPPIFVANGVAGGGGACAVSGTLSAFSPRIWSVTLQGTPVVSDQPLRGGGGGSPPVTVDAFNPCGDSHADWLSCASPPAATPDKNWPVILTRGTSLGIDELRFKSDVPPPQPTSGQYRLQVTGQLASGAKVSFDPVPLSVSGDELVTTGALLSTSPLPAAVSADQLTLSYTLLDGSTQIDMGQTTQPVFVTNGQIATSDANDPEAPRELSIVEMTASAASGQQTPDGIFAKIWAQFQNRSLHPTVLDPTSGDVTPDLGPTLHYYVSGDWTLLNALAGEGIGTISCPVSGGATNILTLSPSGYVGRCRDWALFMVDALASEGISGEYKTVGDFGSAFASVVPEYSPTSVGTTPDIWMLIKPWSFSGHHGTFLGYSRRDRYRDGALVGPVDATYPAPGAPGVGQGSVRYPPGWFIWGDHALVIHDGRIYDPSYGLPATGEEGYPTIAAWSDDALAGYGFIFGPCGGKLGCTLNVHSGANENGVPPVIPRARMSPDSFFPSTRVTPTSGRSARARGATLKYALSTPATVRIQIGRRSHNRWLRVATLSRRSHGGANRVPFSGKIGHRQLAAGRYEAILTARNRSHRESKPVVVKFTIR